MYRIIPYLMMLSILACDDEDRADMNMGSAYCDRPLEEYSGMRYCPLVAPYLQYKSSFMDIVNGASGSGGYVMTIDSIFCGPDLMHCNEVVFEIDEYILLLDLMDTIVMNSSVIKLINSQADISNVNEFILSQSDEYPLNFPIIEYVGLVENSSTLGSIYVNYVNTENGELDFSISGQFVKEYLRLKLKRI